MNSGYFLDIFLKELAQNKDIQDYHRLINSDKLFHFRKAYFEQRLKYIESKIKRNNLKILDLGCGYGTTSLFVASQGHTVIATTIEYYFDKIHSRLEFWKKYIDTSKIEFRYENIFDSDYKPEEFDIIIAQDTLHHIEPVYKALQIIYRILKKDGLFIVVEENGNNIFNNLKNFRRRGFNRIVEKYDEKLGKKILFGNENIRSLKEWKKKFIKSSFFIDNESVEYIRLFPPFMFKKMDYQKIINLEQKLWKRSPFLKNYFFFGVNFVAKLTDHNKSGS